MHVACPESLDREPTRRAQGTSKRILLVGAAPTVGDAAIGEATISSLRRVWPGSEVRILAGDAHRYAYLSNESGISVCKNHTAPFGLASPVIPRSISAFLHFSAAMLSVRAFGGRWFVPRNLQDLIDRHIAWADLIVFQGGPQWVRLKISNERWRRALVAAAKQKGVPVFALGHSFAPAWKGGLREWYCRKLLRDTLSDLSLISVRDLWSVESLKRLKVRNARVVQGTDAAVALETADVCEGSESYDLMRGLAGKQVIAVTARAFQTHYGFGAAEYERLVVQMAQLCDRIAERGGTLLFLSTDYWEHANRKNDFEVFEDVLQKMKHRDDVVRLGRIVPPGELKWIYSQCAALVSVRLHPIILAAGSGVPFVCLAYDDKCRDFMSQLGMERFCFDVETFDAESAGAQLDELLSNRTKWASQISREMDRLRSRCGEVYEEVRRLVDVRGSRNS